MEQPKTPRRRARTSDKRERELISQAYDLAEKQIQKGTASATVITHFLKLATERDRLERIEIENKNKLLNARIETLASQARSEEMYAEALKAMKSYSGQEEPEYED